MTRTLGYQVRVRVQGELSSTFWTELFAGLAVTTNPDGTSVLSGALADQAAVHGLLAAIRDLGLSLVSVETSANVAGEPATEEAGR